MVFLGESGGDYAGGSVSGTGDANGDGRPDLIIGALGDDEAGDEAGEAHVVYGQ